MNRILAYIAALAAACLLGFGAGYYTKGRFVLADQAKTTQAVATQTAKGIVQAVEKSQAIEGAVAAGSDNIAQIKKAAERRPVVRKPQPPLEKPNEEAPAQGAPAVSGRDPDQLDLCTVRLLNAARQGRTAESAGCGDGEVQAAPAAAGR